MKHHTFKHLILILSLLVTLTACSTKTETVEERTFREHCQMMPDMKGCEAFKGQAPVIMNHGSMITSEEVFVVNMIPHHQEAVDTARLILAKGENPELKKLAQNIITAQEKEIAMMNQWKTQWKYSTVPAYENMMGDGSKLSGKELGTWFIHGMIMHHTGAIEMAEAVLKLHPRTEITEFAQAIIRDQSKEIDQMKKMLEQN